MTKKDLIYILTGDFYENFASEIARVVVAEGCIEILYDLATNFTTCPNSAHSDSVNPTCTQRKNSATSSTLAASQSLSRLRVVVTPADTASSEEVRLTKPQIDKLLFRSAYILETIYFEISDQFTISADRFCESFPHCANGSAKRHFGKIMSHMLKHHKPTARQCESIAEAAASWVVEPRVRVVVQIHAIEILLQLRTHVAWVSDVLSEIFETVSRDPLPAMQVRLRRWRAV